MTPSIKEKVKLTYEGALGKRLTLSSSDLEKIEEFRAEMQRRGFIEVKRPTETASNEGSERL
jgi:hypothetical protein